MLHIMLLILKIIGIILLCILGIVLLAILCALFVPLRYRIEVMRKEGDGQPPVVVQVKVTWLLHVVNVLICYPASVYVRVRVFLFTLFQIPEKKRKASRRKKTSGNDTEGKDQPSKAVDSGDGERTEPPTKGKEKRKPKKASDLPETTVVDRTLEGEMEEGDSPEPEDAGLFRRIICKIRNLIVQICQIPEKIKTLLQKMQYTISSLCDKIESTSDTIKYYCEVLQSDAFARSFALCKEQIRVILKEIKPDKFEADVIVGTNDAASTGEILAVYGMLYPLIGEHVRVLGDFEQARIEGQLFLKGKIRAFTFLWIALKVYRNKDIRTLIKLFKKEAV